MQGEKYVNSVNLNAQTGFPYLVLDVTNDESHPRNPGFQVMHWHEDLQFIHVLTGTIEVVTLTERLTLGQGEGVFINRDVVHLVRKLGNCHYNSFIFPDRFVRFYPGGAADALVSRIVGQPELPLVAIRKSKENRDALRALGKLSQLGGSGDQTWSYEVLVTLCTLWLAFSKTVSAPPERPGDRTLEQRTGTFLSYISLHYGRQLTLDELAASAGVSKSECLRCFRAALGTTPHRYLVEFRLSKAAELLRQTDRPVSQVATEVGFGHLSNFGKSFREKTGLSPSEYRKSCRSRS